MSSSTHPTPSSSNIQTLLTEFSSNIDTSLIYAISSDYPETEQGLRSSREILIGLSKEVQTHQESVEEINIGLGLNETDDRQMDQVLDAWDLEQTQIDLASSKADFESDESSSSCTTVLEDGSQIINSDDDQETSSNLSKPDDSPIGLLKCMFPSLAIDVLQDALGSDTSLVDLSVAVDSLLQTHSIPFETINTSDNLDQSRSHPIPKKISPKRKPQPNKKGFQTIHLTDVMRGDERERINEAKKKAEEDGPNGIPENKWVILASQTDFLADLLKIDPSKIKTAYLRHHCNLVLALEEVLNKLVIERSELIKAFSEDELVRFTSNLETFQQLLPDRDQLFLNRFLVVTFNDPDSAFDLIRFLDELFISEGTTIWNLFHRLPIHQTGSDQKLIESDQSSGFHQVSSSKPNRSLVGTRNQMGTDPIHRVSETTCISKASHYRQLRDHAFRQAAQAYQTSRSIQSRRGGALVYAEEGRKYDLKAKYWELEAGKAKVRERTVLDPGPAGMARSVDLHGLSRIQALAVTRDFLNRWESSHEKPSQNSPLLIITGAGKHSYKSTPVLLPAITRCKSFFLLDWI
ncbi:uncharacterized protein MELLADRAFT_67928 [Melampsora larici-populina 98AG31]|uniref:Smr domain-containing protein n=1 Tax=Melampsora larici-populina (strain 98AG31 / pathotype 3-4-7) TaxID=747676 RepID=F4S4Z0_MELLP|nr:uncharacterized protein MELLADRAFT_67928 [Melampsora larici-populina 98AG31]EGG00297.1 hypothetical protein MELLADRAFT_67928 [Melampsora larici-populina 98AG31]